MTISRGRPRASGPPQSGLGTEEDILRAAAKLFCTVGYGSTSTHAIAREAGLRQSSMYHYFTAKHEILLVLLLGTLAPSIEIAKTLLRSTEPAAVRLWALCLLDVRLLASGPVNLGSLYLLPELGDPNLAEFHMRRAELRDAYRELIVQCDGIRESEASRVADMVLALVESVIMLRRAEANLEIADLAPRIADAALRILDLSPEVVHAARTRAAVLAETLSGDR